MPYVLIVEPGVLFAGAHLEVGAVVELSELSAKALVNEGKAVECEPTGETNTALDEQKGTGEPSNGSDDLGQGNGQDEAAAAEIERQKKALADQYNLDDGGSKPSLKAAAQSVGVDFAYDVTKADLIDLIVSQGKAAELLK